MFTNITPLTIDNAGVRILLAEALECDVVEVDDEYLADDCYTFDAPGSDSCTLDDSHVSALGGELAPPLPLPEVRERHLRLVPEPEYDDPGRGR